ncbi:MAG: hypothetical protein GXP61_05470 [Epsilonproteobacteria bacterium]|nr:hypothetical protein [Campylobacterota bacterium]
MEKISEKQTPEQLQKAKKKSLKKLKESTKLTTSKLALELEMKTNELNKTFVQMGYLEKKGKNFTLTKEGKSAGGVVKSNGSRAYILWNKDTKITK